MQQGALENVDGLNVSKTLTDGTVVNPPHHQQPVRTPASLAKLHPSLPERPVFVDLPRTHSTITASSLPAKPRSTPNNDTTFRLTRDLWDTRREMTALQARETNLIASLRSLDAPRHILESGRAQKPSELEVRLAEMENELQRERYKRLQAERGLNEIEREQSSVCRSSSVSSVPEDF
ncbi:hypothetical protein EDB19DRAFT_457391 [Suillus lakei]|nr:hypothetical protein EDB19DRAFT_457391 [Suillus lakei]